MHKKQKKLIEKAIEKQKSLYTFSKLGRTRKRFGIEFSLFKFGHPAIINRFSRGLAAKIRKVLSKEMLSRDGWAIVAPPATLTHPADFLVSKLGHMLGVPVAKLAKKRPMGDYLFLKEAEERRKAVHGSMFMPQPRTVRGKSIILVDDVVVSGHTLREAARVLFDAGAREVHIFNVLELDHKDLSLEGRLNEEAIPSRIDLVVKLINAGEPITSATFKALMRLSATEPELFITVIKKIHKKGRARMLKHFSRYVVREEHTPTALPMVFLKSLLAH